MIWKIFARQPSSREDSEDYARECYRSGVIAVGWSRVGDLNEISSREELKQKLAAKYHDDFSGSPRRLAQSAGSPWNFRNSVKAGHIVVCPDRDSGRSYVGRVLSAKVFYDRSLLGGRCRFAHRRRVRWFRVLKPEDVRLIWRKRFGGEQTVARITAGGDKLRKLVERSPQTFVPRPRLPSRPDLEWGRAAEARAIAWLKERGYTPKHVAHLNLGWDIICDDDRFEVKGRKSPLAAIRLTQNEWLAARRFREKYTLLIFTARTEDELKSSRPKQLPDPATTESWTRRVTYEYVLAE